MKKSATSLENIKKITAFLNAFNDFLNKQKGVIKINEAQSIQDLHKVPYSIMKVAKDLGYFTKIDVQKYQSNFVHFEPIHARTLIEAHKVHRAQKEKENMEKIKIQNPNPSKDKLYETAIKTEPKKGLEGKGAKPIKINPQLMETKIIRENSNENNKDFTGMPLIKKQQRVFSLFWGLIKFNY